MNDELERLRVTRKQRADLKAELSGLQADLENNRKLQEMAILQDRGLFQVPQV